MIARMRRGGLLWAAVTMVATLAPGSLAQSAPGSPPDALEKRLQRLQAALAAQQQQIAEQQREIEALREQVARRNALRVAQVARPAPVEAAAALPPQAAADQPEAPKESPLSFRIGAMQFTPGGFADLAAVFRSTNLGSGLSTSFGAFPFSNTVQGQLSELRLSSQYSRLSLKATGTFGRNQITGYVESDFNGNDPANAFVTSNSHTARLRVYWVDVRRGRWEFLGGQAYSWLAPNRVGLSPLPADVFYTLNYDPNHQVGLTWTRAAQFRVAYHPSEHWALGLEVENPQQFVGAGEVLFPFALNAALAPQFDAGNNPGAPNLHPDLIAKIAYDTDLDGKHFHVEGVGLLTTVRAFDPRTAQTRSATGGGASLAMNLELFKNFRLVANSFWSDGGGRYIDGLGPAAVVRPDGTPSLVHAGAGIAGFEAQITRNHLLGAYYGGAYFQRNSFVDTTSPLGIQPFIGFGGPNSPASANRALQQASFDWIYTFWQNRNYGKLQFLSEWSYITRSPWFVAAGAPKNAHAFLGYMDIRYTLP